MTAIPRRSAQDHIEDIASALDEAGCVVVIDVLGPDVRNRVTEAWEDPELQQRIQPFPRQFGVMQEWLGEDPYVTGRFEGRVETGALAAGQSSALVHDVLPAGEIVRNLVAEAERALARLGS